MTDEEYVADRPSGKGWGLILVVMAVWTGALMRLMLLDQIPPGLSHDEAYNGVTAIDVLFSGRREIFFDIYNGIEPLIIYWEALYFYLFGIAPYVMRLVNVTAGLLTVALTYTLTRHIFARRRSQMGTMIALLAAWGVGSSFWAIFISRLTLRAVTLPLMELLAFYFLWRGLTASPVNKFHRSMIFFALGGFWLGIGMYTYLSSRFLPFVPLIFLLYWIIRMRTTQPQWRGVGLFWLVWCLVFAPLAYFYINHPDIFFRRADQVFNIPAALAGDLQPLLTSVLRTLGMFGLIGPDSSRYGLAGRPVFEPLGAIWFTIGLVIAVTRLRHRGPEAAPYAFLLAWWLVMLVPDFITSESPHYLRTVGALPPTYILWALGLVTSSEWLLSKAKAWAKCQHASLGSTRQRNPSRLSHILAIGVTLYIFFHTGLTGYDYFVRWASDAEARAIYGAEFSEVAHYLRTAELSGPVALSAAHFRDWDRFRLDVLMRHRPPFVVWFHGPQTMLFPPPGVNGTYIFTRGAPPHPRWLEYLQVEMRGVDIEVYHLRPNASWGLARPLDATFVEDLLGSTTTISAQPIAHVWGYELSGEPRAGQTLYVLLGWEALVDVPGNPDYAFYAHLVDRRGYVWAQVDTIGYDAVDWQPGVRALQWLNLSLPPDLPPLEYTLRIGLQERSTSRVLPLEGQTRTNALDLQTVHTEVALSPPDPSEFRLPNPCQIAAGGAFTLRGYSVSKRILHAGEVTHISLFWEVSGAPAARYRLGLWLIGENGAPVMLADREPLEGDYPTDLWRAGQWVRDRFDLTLPASLSPGQYTLFAGWHDASGKWLLDDLSAGLNLGHVLLLAPRTAEHVDDNLIQKGANPSQ